MNDPARFLCDDSLQHLARRLRILGHDVESVRGARLEELLEIASRETRIALTRSHRRPPRLAAVPALTVSGDLATDVRTLAGAYPAPAVPFTRCTVCNGLLAPRGAFEARGEVPARVLRAAGRLQSCTRCGRWFWEGSHAARLRLWFEQVLGRPLPPGPPA